MLRREDIVKEARSWIGTPYAHQGRKKGVGCDCAGVVAAIGVDLLHIPFKEFSYSRFPNKEKMGEVLEKYLERIDVKDIKPGDVVWLKVFGVPQHLAIVTDTGIVHSLATIRSKRGVAGGVVVEHRLSERWKSRIFRAYRFPGVID